MMSQTFMIPKHAIPFRDGYWIFRANHRALHELEHLYGGERSFGDILAKPDGSYTYYYKLLWALSATQRASTEFADVTFVQWLEHLPTGPAWEDLLTKAYEMLSEAIPRKKTPDQVEGEPDPDGYAEGNLGPAQSEPDQQTGGTSSTSRSS